MVHQHVPEGIIGVWDGSYLHRDLNNEDAVTISHKLGAKSIRPARVATASSSMPAWPRSSSRP